MDITDIKQRFGIVGNDAMLNQAIDTAVQVAPIQLSVLIIGESGTGKEVFPQIIHNFSKRKHRPYVAVNCGAIPEGTIDSELFGHEKGSFTGALADRKGYFEEANTGTIFLDEIGELPLATQAKLLRILEKGEYMKVGSSVVKKTDVRIVAATNVDLEKAIADGRFREDLFYRLNGVMIRVPSLRQRPHDIPALFHRFTHDFADRNTMPPVKLSPEATDMLCAYAWPGNVRQLKNVAEQVTVLARDRMVDANEMARFMPQTTAHETPMNTLPQINGSHQKELNSERELLYKILFDMRNDMNDLKKLVMELINNGQANISKENAQIIQRLYHTHEGNMLTTTDYDDQNELNSLAFRHAAKSTDTSAHIGTNEHNITDIKPADVQDIDGNEPTFSIPDNEKELIKKALEKYGGKRKLAAKELGISERTLYRKIHDYGINS